MRNVVQRKRSGAVAVLVAVGMMALCGAAALTIDLGRVTLARQQLQQIADAAAMAGVTRLREGLDPAAARQAALEVIAANQVLGQPVGADGNVDVYVGAWNATSMEVGPLLVASDGSPSVPGGMLAVQVQVRRTTGSPAGPVPMSFARALGVSSVELSAKAVGGLSIQQYTRTPVDLVTVLDYSGSFGSEFTYARDAVGDFSTKVGAVALPGPSEGMGDKVGFVGFGDYEVNSTYYPTLGWTDVAYGAWSVSEVARNFPLALTRMDTDAGKSTVGDKFTSTSGRVFHFSCGSHESPERYASRLYSSSTNTAAGLLAAAGMLKNAEGQWTNPDARHVVVLVSDGMPFFHAPDGSKTEAYSKAQTTAAANTLAAMGVVIHTVTLCQDTGGTSYGFSGSDAGYNASLTRNGGYAFHSADPLQLRNMMLGVGAVEYGRARLLR